MYGPLAVYTTFMQDCPYFCERRAEHAPEVFEIDGIQHYFYEFDVHPATPGHVLVIPKRHFADFKDINIDEKAELVDAVLAVYGYLQNADLLSVYERLMKQMSADRPKIVPYIESAVAHLKGWGNRAPDGYNHGLNDGRAAGRTVDHLHYHVMPRWNGDMVDVKGGIRRMFEGKADYTK